MSWAGSKFYLEAEVFLDGLDPKSIQVELYAYGTNGGGGASLGLMNDHGAIHETS